MRRSGLLLAIALVAVVVSPFHAVADSGSYLLASLHLKSLGIISGDPSGDLRLNDQITRGELTKIQVVALAYPPGNPDQATAKFTDVAGHWAAGYIAAATKLKLVSGYPDGTFRPDGYVTVAEAITMIDRIVLLSPTGRAWPLGYLDAAVRARIIPQGLQVYDSANQRATRGWVFALADNAFSKVPVVEGKSVYQLFWSGTVSTVSPPHRASGSTSFQSGSRSKGTISTAVNDETFVIEFADGTKLSASAKTFCPLYFEGDNVVVVADYASGFMVKSGADKCEFWTEDIK